MPYISLNLTHCIDYTLRGRYVDTGTTTTSLNKTLESVLDIPVVIREHEIYTRSTF